MPYILHDQLIAELFAFEKFSAGQIFEKSNVLEFSRAILYGFKEV